MRVYTVYTSVLDVKGFTNTETKNFQSSTATSGERFDLGQGLQHASCVL